MTAAVAVLDRLLQLGWIDRLAAAAASVQLGERRRAGQAPGVGGQDPRVAGRARAESGRPRIGPLGDRRYGPAMTDVRLATLDDVDLLARIAAAGFYDDPVMSWVFPDDAVRLGRLTFMFGGLARDMVPDRGVVHLAADASAAFWRDPSFEHGRTAADRAEDAADAGPHPFTPDELERLGVLGVDDDGQPPPRAALVPQRGEHPARPPGPGLGSAVLQPVLDRCDADGARAYLESTQPPEPHPLPPPRLRRRRRDHARRRPEPHPDVARPAALPERQRVRDGSAGRPYDGRPMASLSRDEVAHVAKLARLQLTDEQLDTFTPQLAAILEHAADVEALDLADVPPTSHPYPLKNVLAARRGRSTPASATPCWPRRRPPRTACSACRPSSGRRP